METPKVKSLYKAISLLNLFTNDEHELSTTAIASRTNLPKSSVSNIMSTFTMCGFVKQNPSNHKYQLDKKVLTLANIFTNHNTLSTKLKKHMQEYSNQVGELLYYAIPYGTNILYISSTSPKDSMTATSISGYIAPMYCTGLGKVILAYSSDEIISQVLASDLVKITDQTIVTPESLKEELAKIRQNGYAIDNMEHEHGVKCVALPILQDNEIIGSLSISGPSLRFSDERILTHAQELKKIISNAID